MRILNTLPETFRLYRLLWIFNSQSFALSTKKRSFRRKTLFSGATRNRTKDTRPEIFNSQSFALSTKKRSFRRKTLFSGATRNRTKDTRPEILTLSPLLYQQKKSLSEEKLFLKWCHQESNRGHKARDF